MAPTHMSWAPRAHGRATQKARNRINIEVVVREDESLETRAASREESRED